ncbi:MAG TPA: basic secretory protein-like protein [Gemmataceae bacterium]|nr:basic secretory protein-like protein [Gemmataceae bacterium]
MTRPTAPVFALLAAALLANAQPPAPPVIVSVESSLPTATGQIRQFAFDGDPDTHFASARNATKDDHFTVVFEKGVFVKSVSVKTGRPDGGDELAAGALEFSADGKKFVPLAKFDSGSARGDGGGRKMLAVRVKPTGDQNTPLVVREVVVDSTPKLAAFKYPVEVVVKADEVPDMKAWGEKAARICERNYGMICDELWSEGYKPEKFLTLTFKKDYKGIGVAEAWGTAMTASADFFRKNPTDFGAFIHEATHLAQLYRKGGEPPWLVEGIADYIRYFKYEPGKLGKLTPEQAKYDGSYGTTARFLDYVERTHSKGVVKKLNAALREGRYTEETWKEITGKSVVELGQKWRASLAK